MDDKTNPIGNAARAVIGNLRVDPAKTSDAAARQQTMLSKPMPSIAPMGTKEAAKLVVRLLAGYPNLTAHDPEGYRAALVQVMAEYPRWAGEQAIIKVDAENAQFPPSDKTLRLWLNDAVRPWKFAMEWEARAAKQIEERKLLEDGNGPMPEPEAAEQRGKIYSNFDEATKEHGKPFGAFDVGRKLPYRG